MLPITLNTLEHMREIVTLFCSVLFIAMSTFSTAQGDMVNYTLDANEDIYGCKIVSLKMSGDVGQVESILGSKLNLRIHRDNAYKVTINEKKIYYLQYDDQLGFAEVDGIKLTTHNALASWAIDSEEAAESDPGMKYRIQIGAFVNDIAMSPLKNLGQLYTEEIDGGITRYMIGSFGSQEEAIKAQARIKEQGYVDAFTVVCYNGKRISLTEARKMEEEQSNLTYN